MRQTQRGMQVRASHVALLFNSEICPIEIPERPVRRMTGGFYRAATATGWGVVIALIAAMLRAAADDGCRSRFRPGLAPADGAGAGNVRRRRAGIFSGWDRIWSKRQNGRSFDLNWNPAVLISID